MTCPKCQKTASGMFCQACGNGLMTAELDKQAQPKAVATSDVDGIVSAAVAKATIETKRKYQEINATNMQNASEAYLTLSNEYSKLLAAHEELKDELSKITTELANASAVKPAPPVAPVVVAPISTPATPTA